MNLSSKLQQRQAFFLKAQYGLCPQWMENNQLVGEMEQNMLFQFMYVYVSICIYYEMK